jgi:hypothetical protein
MGGAVPAVSRMSRGCRLPLSQIRAESAENSDVILVSAKFRTFVLRGKNSIEPPFPRLRPARRASGSHRDLAKSPDTYPASSDRRRRERDAPH